MVAAARHSGGLTTATFARALRRVDGCEGRRARGGKSSNPSNKSNGGRPQASRWDARKNASCRPHRPWRSRSHLKRRTNMMSLHRAPRQPVDPFKFSVCKGTIHQRAVSDHWSLAAPHPNAAGRRAGFLGRSIVDALCSGCAGKFEIRLHTTANCGSNPTPWSSVVRSDTRVFAAVECLYSGMPSG
jgi:hypothetical protein